ncbi:MAG: hydroxylamine reductase [Clostridia bacterium]|nr:hydroxylamine reductase [Clostridia bacterium]
MMNLNDYRDLLDLATKSLSAVTTEMRVELLDVPKEADMTILYNLCMTSQGVSYSEDVLKNRIAETLAMKREYMAQIKATRVLPEDALWDPAGEDEYEKELATLRIRDAANVDAKCLRQLIVYGLKGVALFAAQAYEIGYEDEGISPFLQRVLQRTLKFNLSVGLLFNLAMEVGGFGYRAMGLLDKAASEAYGVPEITNIELGVRKKPGILISGSGISELETLLRQTEGTGVEVYTHGEMLPVHTYPKFKHVDHFAGNYGGSVKTQAADFASFNGPVVVAGDGLLPPEEAYKDRLFTASPVNYPGVTILPTSDEGETDYSEVIKLAKTCEPPAELRKGELIAGFAHEQLFKMLDVVEGALNDGSIERMVAVIGSDSDSETEQYYTDLAGKLPKNSAILTAGSVAYRMMNQNLGTVHGLPRLMVTGQLTDMYSIAMVALKLQADLEKYDINAVPISYLVSLDDEKSVCALLALTYVGAKNILIGPAMPDFMTENIASVFQKNFGTKTIGSVDEDVEGMFAKRVQTGEGEPIDMDMLIVDILERYPGSAEVLMNCGMSCITCGAALYESLAEACMVHGLDPEDVKEVLDHELGLVSDDD